MVNDADAIMKRKVNQPGAAWSTIDVQPKIPIRNKNAHASNYPHNKTTTTATTSTTTTTTTQKEEEEALLFYFKKCATTSAFRHKTRTTPTNDRPPENTNETKRATASTFVGLDWTTKEENRLLQSNVRRFFQSILSMREIPGFGPSTFSFRPPF